MPSKRFSKIRSRFNAGCRSFPAFARHGDAWFVGKIGGGLRNWNLSFVGVILLE